MLELLGGAVVVADAARGSSEQTDRSPPRLILLVRLVVAAYVLLVLPSRHTAACDRTRRCLERKCVPFPDHVSSMTSLTLAVGPLPRVGNIGAAVVLALLSTGCYATSAVLQEREAARQDYRGAALVWRLAHRPWWWVAVAATVAGAVLHIVALALGPLSLVQPLGVLVLVLALPLGARLGGRVVTRGQWRAAAAVVLGLTAVLTLAPHRVPPSHLAPSVILFASVTVGASVLVLVGLAAHLAGRGAPVVRAAAAATCFGFASGMARIAVTGTAPFLLSAVLAVLGAVSGLGLAQLAYRTGGLGAPLATQNLVDPLVAVIIGVTLLGEPLQLTPGRVATAAIGLVATLTGIWALTRPPHSPSPLATGSSGAGAGQDACRVRITGEEGNTTGVGR
jgi:hypothetical protein